MPSLLFVGEDARISNTLAPIDSDSTFCSPKELLPDIHKGPFDGIYLLSQSHDEVIFVQLAQRLKPSAKLFIQTKENVDTQTEKNLIVALTKAGYIDIKTNSLNSGQISAAKPDWDIGVSQPLKLSTKNQTEKVNKPSNTAVWTLTTDEDELEDEDTLLQEEDLIIPTKKPKDDCEVGKGGSKKACKNCSCGRKEGTSTVATPQVKSSCGSCYLGDAFRCSGCPFLGKQCV